MNMKGLPISNAFAGHKARNSVAAITRSAPSFETMLHQSIKEKSLADNHPFELDSSPKKCRCEEDVKLSELENKYCSLCGSPIDEEGNCPICIIPVFISGHQLSHGQNVSQGDRSNPASESESTILL